MLKWTIFIISLHILRASWMVTTNKKKEKYFHNNLHLKTETGDLLNKDNMLTDDSSICIVLPLCVTNTSSMIPTSSLSSPLTSPIRHSSWPHSRSRDQPKTFIWLIWLFISRWGLQKKKKILKWIAKISKLLISDNDQRSLMLNHYSCRKAGASIYACK